MSAARAVAAALFVFVFWVGILMPFEFRWPESMADEFGGATDEPWTLLDAFGAAGHAFFFVPLGFWIERLLESGRRRHAVLVAVLAIVQAVASEMAQLFVDRSTSAADLVMDLLGVAIGYVLAGLWRRSPRMRAGARIVASPAAAVGFLAIVSGAAAFLLLPLRAPLSGWDPDFPLVLGNEATGDRSWRGDVFEVALLDRALTPREVALLPGGDALTAAVTALRPVVHIRPGSALATGRRIEELVDLADPTLRLIARGHGAGEGVALVPGGGVSLGPGAWFSSRRPPRGAGELVRAAGELTLICRFRARDPDARGPARIVSYSLNPSERNLTLGQEARDLHFRVRNTLTGPNGARPELIVPDGVRPGDDQLVVGTDSPTRSLLFVDGHLSGAVGFTRLLALEMAVFSRPLQPFAAGLLIAAFASILAGAWALVLRRSTRTAGALLAAAVACAVLTVVALWGVARVASPLAEW